jgi:hypothetical protein
MGPSTVVFALVLELLFLAFCAILVGAGLSEIKKRKNYAQNATLVFFGVALAVASLYMAMLFLQG